MQTPSRKSNETKNKKEQSKDESKKIQEENKPKKNIYTISTPREYLPKTSATDIYAQRKNIAKTPKKVPGVSSTANLSPMKGLLKSSSSSVSLISRSSDRTPKKVDSKSFNLGRSSAKTPHSSKAESLKKKELFTNVTVNSPVVKRKLDWNSEPVTKEALDKKVSKTKEVGNGDTKRTKSGKIEHTEKLERQRTKTRTLDESEVKILTPVIVDNNAEMMNLSKKLVAKPKAFYVDLDEEKAKPLTARDKSDEEVSYEDDFESYESDFDSYHSNESEANDRSEASDRSEANDRSEASGAGEQARSEAMSTENSLKEKDEEKMLDSGNFDLRDQRSSKTKPTVMDFILEDGEKPLLEVDSTLENSEKKVSLDEGFLDMNSTASSMKTVDILDRPLFINFTKSNQNKTKRKINERLKQRAKDLLGMITLHEMSYSLYEMQPISYDLYMATFGRSNYTQSGVQTFDDGISEEVQTEEISMCQKWTQCPVEFSKHDIYRNKDVLAQKYSPHTEDYLAKFTFLIRQNYDDLDESQMKLDESYTANPLRIYFEQKDGVGTDEMLPYEIYKSKLKSNDYNAGRLSKFLKKCESKVSLILSKNTGFKDLTDFERTGKLPFSKGYVKISSRLIQGQKYSFLKPSKITQVFFSQNKSNLLVTAHKNVQGVDVKKSIICIWDLSVAREPVKMLLAIDDITIGRFRGNTDGLFTAGLEDGSIHLWDLTEEPTWRSSVASEEKPTEFVEVGGERLAPTERDREWNLRNSNVGLQQSSISFALQSCAYTSSASNMDGETSDCIVGLEINNTQIVSLQRIGILTIWSIIEEKSKNSKDIGKAFWSKLKLERNQTINITQHVDTAIKENGDFNLNSAKRRIAQRKQEKYIIKKDQSRPKTASNFDFDMDRPYSAASLRKRVVPVEINVPKNWENGIVCSDLKIITLDNVNSFLVAKNGGEVLCCKRCLGAVKMQRFSVASDTSTVTSLDVCEPYFLAATDAGTISLCSLTDNRVLLTLDCRNVPLPRVVDQCVADHQGRFVSSSSVAKVAHGIRNRIIIKSVHWSRANRCCIFALLQDKTLIMFDLTHSDIDARAACGNAAAACVIGDNTMALLTPEGDAHVHRLSDGQRNAHNLNIFNKYAALL